jgi:hypothetical protein
MTRYIFLLLSLLIPYIPSSCVASDATTQDDDSHACYRDEDCQYGGTCAPADRFSEFNRCNCKRGRGGAFCEHSCPLTCQNNGACRTTLHNSSAFECVCRGEYAGDLCEIPFVECPDHSLCLHGGACVLSTDLIQSYSCHCPPGFDGSAECAVNPNHVQTTVGVGEKLEEDAVRLEFVMILVVGALLGSFAFTMIVRSCSERRGYRSNINAMRDDMDYSFDPKAYYFDPKDLENIEMI